MRIMITGGAGFIGSTIVDTLLAEGKEICVIDDLNEYGGGKREHVSVDARFEKIDIRDADLVSAVVASFKPEAIVHQAAQTSVARSARLPHFDADVNVLGTLNLLGAAAAHSVRKIIFASSAATFGTVEHLPASERTPQRPLSPYGMTKLIGEQYLAFYHRSCGLEYTILRYGNVYGPRQNALGEGGVVAIFSHRFATGSAVRINGDGEQTRDFVFVRDVARANVLALSAGAQEAYVIGTGIRTSVNQLYRELCEITGITPTVEYLPPRLGEARNSILDSSKAQRELDWKPTFSIRDGLAETYRAMEGSSL